ncbi:MAG: helix-turn-helix domain-containing protein [Chloroflexota bacterium]
MTTRDEGARRSRGASRDAERSYAVETGPSLPERLLAARERKGVDLYRAERDTKIRSRYLAALEQGDYAELPGAVYTKGFLRNYALYLGLDPEDVIRQWRRERGDEAVPAEPVLSVPKALAAPRPGLTFSPVVIIAALLTIVIGLFAVYFGVQLVRFAKPPTLAVSDPAQAVLDLGSDATTYTFRGTSIPGATISVKDAAKEQPYRETADSGGRWTVAVDLRRGKNQFDVSAIDPETGKSAEQTPRFILTVPFLVIEAPTLNVESPAEGAQFENGAIPVRGTTSNAKTVSITAYQTATADGTPVGPLPSASPGASADPSAAPPANVTGPVTVDVASDGSFDSPLDLSAGKWQIVVTATSGAGKAVTLTRNVSIQYQGVNLVLEIRGSSAWIKVWVDGKIWKTTGAGGQVYSAGKVLTITAETTIEIRTGKSSATYFTLNGRDLGHLSTKGNPETWLFAPPADPVRTTRT